MSQPITYSSLISLSLAKFPQVYMYTDGFMSNDFELISFNSVHGNLFHDFQNTVFRIIPVLNFKWTQKLLKEIVQEDFQKLSEIQVVKQRKGQIQSLRTNLDGEVTSNISLTSKLTGVPLIFGSSTFMLVHVTSLKFLTLNDENPEDLHFQLKDFPEEGSIMKFTPCLNFQKLRTNIVYNKDAVILSSTKVVCNRPPSLYTFYKGQEYKYKESKDKQLKKQFQQEIKRSKIIGSIEYQTRWRVEGYHCASNNEKQSEFDDYLHVGDVIALYLSELKLHVNALKPYDPFKKILQILKIENLTSAEPQTKQKDQLLKLTKTQQNLDKEFNLNQSDAKILKRILIEDVVVTFQNFNYFNSSESQKKLLDLPNSCFWKIESADQMSGGRVDWNKIYRLRHYQTGRYLQITKNGSLVDMELISEPNQNALFKFSQIQNSEDSEVTYIKRDSFYYLLHIETGQYLGISDEVNEINPKIEQLSKEAEVEVKQAYLSVVQNHYTTFRVKKIDFSDMWETYMLQYSLPFFLEAIDYIQRLHQKHIVNSTIAYNDEDIKSKLHFYQIFLKLDRMLDMYCEFVNNKLISNISAKQEYSYIVTNRQNVVREQNIFILLVWMLFRCFPSRQIIEKYPQKFEAMKIDFMDEKDFIFRVQSFLQSNTLKHHPRMLVKLEDGHNKRQIYLSYKVYMTIKDFCKDNKSNQRTLMKLLNIFYNHIGLGDQIVDTLANSISKTKSILQQLPKTMISMPQKPNQDEHQNHSTSQDKSQMQGDQIKVMDQSNLSMTAHNKSKERVSQKEIELQREKEKEQQKLKEQQEKQKEKEKQQKNESNSLQAIILKLLEFPPFSKPDIIYLLATVCQSLESPVFVNQNLIYRAFFENKLIYNHAFMKLTYKFGDLLLTCLDKNDQPVTIKFLDFFDDPRLESGANYQRQFEYIKNELNLIANLCLSRNTLACKTFQQTFLFNKTLPFVENSNLKEEIRAVFLKLIRVLYIDQEPYQTQKRPELVREIIYDKSILTTKLIKQDGGILSMLKMNANNYVSFEEIQKRQLEPLISKDTILYQTMRVKKLRQQQINWERIQKEQAIDESEVEESEEVKKFLQSLIKILIQHIQESAQKLSSLKQGRLIYNILTLEVIQIVKLIFQFGFFNYEYIKPPNQHTKKSQAIMREIEKQIKNSEIEQIIQLLAQLLEYDEQYNQALENANVQRKYIENKLKRDEKKKKNAFDDLANLGNINLDMMNLLDGAEKQKKERKIIHQDIEMEIINDPLFRKVKQLKKILDKCSNKTFSIKQEDQFTQYEVQIKMEICEIFILMLGMRQDFLIDNAIDFFKQQFVPYQVSMIDENHNYTDLLPELGIEVGEDVDSIQTMKEYCEKFQTVRNFDIILDRPFYETLILSLFFSTNAKLSNKIVELIEKYSSQRYDLVQNLTELQVVVSMETIAFYKKWSRLLNKLKRNIPNCQAWLQLDTPQKLNGRNETNFQKNLKLVKKIIDVFQENAGDNQRMKIKQRIFKHVGGFDSMLELMLSCMIMIINNRQVFTFKEAPTSFSQYQQHLAKLILQLLECILQIMVFFGKNSIENQELVFHKVVPHLTKYRRNNFNQSQFITDLLNDNPKLTQHINRDREIEYFFKLIKKHGRYTEFIDFFLIILKNAESNKTGQSNVLSMHIINFVLDKKYFEFCNPFVPQPKLKGKSLFYQHKPQSSYLGKFIIMLAQCLKNYIGVSLTYRAQQTFKLNLLLDSLVQISSEERETAFEQFNQLEVKTCIFEIIMVVLERAEKKNLEIMSCSEKIQEFLVLESQFLNSRQQFSNAQLIYLFQKQSPFLLQYFKAFYKDAGAKLFQNAEQSKIERKKIQEYGKAFLNALNHMSQKTIMDDVPKISMVEDLCKALKIDIPKSFRRPVNSDDEIDDDEEEQEDETDDKAKQISMDVSNENTHQKGSFTTGPPLVNENTARAFLQKFKSLKAKQLQTDKKDNEDSESKQINYYWQLFVSLLSDNEQVHEAIKEEKQIFANSVWNISQMFQSDIKSDQKDLVLNQEDVVKNLLNYIQYWQVNAADKKSVLFIFKALKQILKNPFRSDDLDELRERQEILNKLNATKILMQLLWSEDENDLQYLTTLLSLFCMLLKKGNLVVQTTILEYSKSNQECEKLYFKLNLIITNYINSNPAELKQQGKLQTKLICKTLQFMQLLCEGHNLQLQEYLHQQTNSKTSYDLVLQIVKLQQCIKIDNKNYGIVTQCFDTITEVIQGPCKTNQIALSNSKFMEYVVDVLSENEKLFETQEIQKKQEAKLLGVIFKQVQTQKKEFKSFNQMGQTKEQQGIKRNKIMDPTKPYNLTLHLAKLARLKLKALISLVSLVECCDLQDNLILRIIRAIPIRVLTNNMSRVYSLFQQYFKDEYKEELFGRAEQLIVLTEEEEKYELVVEIGFYIYVLMQIFVASKKGKDILQEDIEMREILNEFDVDRADEQSTGLFSGISKLGGQMLQVGLGGLQKFKQGIEEVGKTDEDRRKEKEAQELEEKKKNKELLKNSIRFFKKNSCSIEIVRDEKVYQVFFPKLPYCHQLPKDLKTEFHDEVNRSSAKTKLNYLMTKSDSIIKTMKHEEYLRILFNINPIFGAIASQGKLWELCLFLTTIAINLIILFSYSQFLVPDQYLDNDSRIQYYRLYEPRLLWYDQLSITKQIILILGILDLVFSSLIVFFFALKRAPLKVYHIWVGFFSTQGFFKIIIRLIKNSLVSIFVLLQDFEILYYSAYILAGIVGLAAHPFFFCVHLMDFLKLDQLKTVVQAIWKPKVELGLALMLLIIIEYYFNILAWIVFYNQYPASGESGQEYCNEFWRCLITTFDWTFKFTGSIGAHLQDPATLEELQKQAVQQGDEDASYDYVNADQTAIYYERFFFDNLFNIMLVFILLNMIQGIIIDTFSSLREDLAEKNKDMEFKCFVCGFDMETLDKSSDSDKGFAFHIKYEHHMWNYVFYFAYLQFKDPTEYDGNETFVSNKMENLDLGWLPIKKAKCITDENQEDKKKLEQLDLLNKKADKIEEDLKKQTEKVEKIYKSLLPE
ncbi:unnamed protein product [Paramecium octaurelia]|uniref:MIR domain-containing protein n=1 Tax=Paramecium octaurelia TaxID=43137 RepID=A0A8S1S1P5_PAROT|nr:unnamed protein product [Paramecium octaurelia]